MPDFCFKLHHRRLEWILTVELNPDKVFATRIRRVSGAIEPALEVSERLLDGGGVDARVVLVLRQVLQLLDDAAVPTARHVVRRLLYLSWTQRVVPVGEKKRWSAVEAECVMLDNETLMKLVEAESESSLAVGSEMNRPSRREDAGQQTVEHGEYAEAK